MSVSFWCSSVSMVRSVLLIYIYIYISKKAILPLPSSSFVNFVSGNAWLMYKKKVFTFILFTIANISST